MDALSFTARTSSKEKELLMKITGRIANNPFIIEGLPEESDEECVKAGLKDVRLVECKGKIKIRPSKGR